MKHLVWLLFLLGSLCNPDLLTIQPNTLVTWKGSCVWIPCTIGSYRGQSLRDVSLLWYFQPFFDGNRSDYTGTLLYDSSDKSRNAQPKSASQPQVDFIGNLKNKNCSLKISRVHVSDSGIYGARLIASQNSQELKWFLNATVKVAESPPDPRMEISSNEIGDSQKTTVTCSVPYNCHDDSLELFVSGLGRLSSPGKTSNNGIIQTVMHFSVTWEDNEKTLVCSLRQDQSELARSTMQLDVKYRPKNVQLKATPRGIVREGQRLSLECTFENSNPPVSEYLWYKDDQRMFEYQDVKKIAFEAQGDRHSGDYRCEAKNSIGTQSSNTHHIDVHYPPKEVKVDRMPQVNIKEGESLVLQCSSKGNPETHYQWFKQPLTTIFENGKQLQFDVVQLENAGAYYCSAWNMLGSSKSSPVTLNVQYAPKDVQLAIENDQLPIKEKDTVLLNCSFGQSNPSNDIKYKWYKANSRLRSEENLLNFPANLEQAGDYRCEVCNTIECSSSPSVTVDIHYAPKGVTAVAEQRIPINEGNRVNLRCEVANANPEVFSYRWYKDVVQQPVDSEAAELTIYHVTSAHSGRYWCEATNSVATSRSQQLLLKVYYGPRNISLSLERQVPVTEGMDVSFLCATDANPPPYYFELYRNKEMLLKTSDRILLLQKVKVEDSGDYHCKASNGISTGKSQTLTFSVSYSRATKLKHGMKGLGIILGLIVILGMVIFALKAWKKKRGPGATRTETSGSFIVRKPKPEKPSNNRAHEGAANSHALLNEGAEETVCYAMLRFPPGVPEEQVVYSRVNAPRVTLDPSEEEVVYSVINKPGPLSKGDTKHDYENVMAQKEEELHYSSLVNLTPRPHPTYKDWETDSESEESIQYAALKH